MHPSLDSRLLGFALLLIALAVGFVQAGRSMKRTKQALQDRGSSWSIGLGQCLSGLPGLDASERVSCGGTGTELILVSEADAREVGRIPWSPLLEIFGGDSAETGAYLVATGGMPSLIQAEFQDDTRKKQKPSYVVIDWNDSASRRQQALFELRGTRMGAITACILDAKNPQRDHRRPINAAASANRTA
jgi:hypothetical protein